MSIYSVLIGVQSYDASREDPVSRGPPMNIRRPMDDDNSRIPPFPEKSRPGRLASPPPRLGEPPQMHPDRPQHFSAAPQGRLPRPFGQPPPPKDMGGDWPQGLPRRPEDSTLQAPRYQNGDRQDLKRANSLFERRGLNQPGLGADNAGMQDSIGDPMDDMGGGGPRRGYGYVNTRGRRGRKF